MSISIHDLEFRYGANAEPLYGGLTHEFEEGVVTAISGPSGRGKSTLLYILGLLLAPTSGHVDVDGIHASNLSDVERSAIRAHSIGFVFQDSELDWTRSIEVNVMEPGIYAGHSPAELKDKAHLLLNEFGITHRKRHKPGQISGGQAQRVALCRALINDPRVVLADEPTGNLDEAASLIVTDALTRVARSGCTVIIATHDPRVISQADKVLAL